MAHLPRRVTPKEKEEAALYRKLMVSEPTLPFWNSFTWVKRILRAFEQAIPAMAIVAASGYLLFGTDQGADILRGSINDTHAAMTLFAAIIIVVTIGVAAGMRLAEIPLTELTLLIATVFVLFIPVAMIGVIFGSPSLPNYQGSWILLLVVIGSFLLFLLITLIVFFVALLMFKRLLFLISGLFARRVTAFFLGLSILLVVSQFPAIANWLGSTAILALCACGWLFVVTSLASWRRQSGIPLLALLLTLMMIHFLFVPLTGSPGNQIRGIARFKPGRTMQAAYNSWLQDQQNGVGAIVLVAAAGGGVRASYWTARVLSVIADQAPTVRRSLFLGSGVSGGSLGLVVFRALLQLKNTNCVGESSLAGCATKFHQHDFLAGILGERLTGSLLGMLLPLPFPSRNLALEYSWEAAWRDIVPSTSSNNVDVFAEPFAKLWEHPNPGMSLVLNTTSTTGGDRIPISDLETIDWMTNLGPCKANIAEHVDLPVSAAVNASALFPVLEEWDVFEPLPSKRDQGRSVCKSRESVADGGFFENYGASTVIDALNALAKIWDSKPDSPHPHVIVIQITSDPDCQIADRLDEENDSGSTCREQLSARRNAASRVSAFDTPISFWRYLLNNFTQDEWKSQLAYSNHFNTWFREWLLFREPSTSPDPGIIDVAMNARAAGGIQTASALRCRVNSLGGSYYHFSMVSAFDAPLGWVLSKRAKTELDELLEKGANARALNALVAEMSGGPAQAPNPRVKNC